MKRKLGAACAAALSALCVPAIAATADDVDADLRALRAQIETLQTRQQALEQELAAQRRAATAAAPGVPRPDAAGGTPPPGGIGSSTGSPPKPSNVFTDAVPNQPVRASLRALQLPGTNTWLRVGGMLKVDAIDDPDQVIGDQSNPGGLQVSGAAAHRTQSFRMLARQSRFFVDTSTQVSDDKLHTFIEADFYGTGGGTANGANAYNLALRHAYAEYGSYLVGQTWSTFMDLDTQPEGLDNSGPTGRAAIRQTMVRYTRAFGPNTLQLAVENPEADFNGADYAIANATSQNIKNRYPDLIGAWRFDGAWGHVRLAAVARRMGVQDGVHPSSSTNGWGTEFSGVLKPTAADSLGWQLNAGRGIGRYLQDSTGYGAYLRPDGELVPQFASGGLVSWQHVWSPQWRGNLFVGDTRIDNAQPVAVATASALTRSVKQATVNLVWSPMSGVNIGGQFTRYEREVESQQKVDANRIQFSAWYFF